MAKKYVTVTLRILSFPKEDLIATSGPADNPYVTDFYDNGGGNHYES